MDADPAVADVCATRRSLDPVIPARCLGTVFARGWSRLLDRLLDLDIAVGDERTAPCTRWKANDRQPMTALIAHHFGRSIEPVGL